MRAGLTGVLRAIYCVFFLFFFYGVLCLFGSGPGDLMVFIFTMDGWEKFNWWTGHRDDTVL